MPKTGQLMAKDLSGEIAIIDGALSDIEEELAKAAASSRTRALRAKFETYRRVMSGWEHRPPNESQCATLFECVMELHDEVFGRAAGEGAWRTGNRISDAPAAAEPDESEPPSRRSTVPVPDDAELPADALPSAHPDRASERPTTPPDSDRPTMKPEAGDD